VKAVLVVTTNPLLRDKRDKGQRTSLAGSLEGPELQGLQPSEGANCNQQVWRSAQSRLRDLWFNLQVEASWYVHELARKGLQSCHRELHFFERSQPTAPASPQVAPAGHAQPVTSMPSLLYCDLGSNLDYPESLP